MSEQGIKPQEKGQLGAAEVVVRRLNLDENGSERILRQFKWAQRIADLASDKDSATRTRAVIDRLAASSTSLDLSAISPDVAEEMAAAVSRSLALERTVPLTDLFLAIEHAARSIRKVLFAPGRPTNMPLHLTVQTLLPAFENACSDRVRVKWNKAKSLPPESGNDAMSVFVELVRLILPNVTDIAVFNAVDKSRSARRSIQRATDRTNNPLPKKSGL